MTPAMILNIIHDGLKSLGDDCIEDMPMWTKAGKLEVFLITRNKSDDTKQVWSISESGIIETDERGEPLVK